MLGPEPSQVLTPGQLSRVLNQQLVKEPVSVTGQGGRQNSSSSDGRGSGGEPAGGFVWGQEQPSEGFMPSVGTLQGHK